MAFKKQIEKGDRIISLPGLEVHTLDDVVYVPDSNKRDYILSTTEGRILLAEEDEFEVLEPSTFIPTAGDQVIVTNIFVTNDIVGHKFSVIKSRMCPDELSDISKCIWCTNGLGYVSWFKHKSYETIKRQLQVCSDGSCPDCDGTGKIMLLTSTVKCDCCNS